MYFHQLTKLAPGGLFKLNLAQPEAPLSRDRRERCFPKEELFCEVNDPPAEPGAFINLEPLKRLFRGR
jgi:hypothetical protein